MRCRRVRSCLSAYCNDELSSRLKLAVSEHLSTCSACRREEAVYRSMAEATKELSSLAVAGDFNSKLFNRIAQERFAETRTRAYLPKRAPVVLWRQAIPAFVTVSLVVLLAFVAFRPSNTYKTAGSISPEIALDDSYLTVQPANDARRTANLNKGWSLGNELARAERMNRLSSAIVGQGVWSRIDRSPGLRMASMQKSTAAPFVMGYYRVRPVKKIYISPESPSDKEAGKAY